MECVRPGPPVGSLWTPIQGSDSLGAVCPTPSAPGVFLLGPCSSGRFLSLLHVQAPSTLSPFLPPHPRLTPFVHLLMQLEAARVTGGSHT